jgi:hypothetical protein
MLTRYWRIVLLLISLVFTLWPGLFDKSPWLVIGSLVVLLFGELTCDGCAAPSKKKKKK